MLDALHDYRNHYEFGPYLRFLKDMAACAMVSEQYNAATFALEEVIRCDHTPCVQSAQALLLCYFGMIGQSKCGHVSELPRTEAHLNALLSAKLPHSQASLFDPKKPEAGERWIKIVRRFESRQEYFSLVRKEKAGEPWLLPYLFNKSASRSTNDFVLFKVAEYIKFAVNQYPDFMTSLHDHVEPSDAVFDRQMKVYAFTHLLAGARMAKAEQAQVARGLLADGRAKMVEGDMAKAGHLFAGAKRQTGLAMVPSHRWYMNAPFAISSNRATLLEYEEDWTFARMETRFTLLAAPDHLRSYQRIARIAEASGADLSPYLAPLMAEVAEAKGKTKSIAEWRRLARRAIAMVSLAGIIHARRGSLTPEKLEELERVGIEDMYTPVNVDGSVMPVLPWLTQADLEDL
jgi:hypothetical protein